MNHHGFEQSLNQPGYCRAIDVTKPLKRMPSLFCRPFEHELIVDWVHDDRDSAWATIRSEGFLVFPATRIVDANKLKREMITDNEGGYLNIDLFVVPPMEHVGPNILDASVESGDWMECTYVLAREEDPQHWLSVASVAKQISFANQGLEYVARLDMLYTRKTDRGQKLSEKLCSVIGESIGREFELQTTSLLVKGEQVFEAKAELRVEVKNSSSWPAIRSMASRFERQTEGISTMLNYNGISIIDEDAAPNQKY